MDALAWDKGDGLIPAIVQCADTAQVLMLGYMNRAALELSQSSARVTFYSRSKRRLWTKGELSGHHLALLSIRADCDRDTLLVFARPHGPTCHNGTSTCFGEFAGPELSFLGRLQQVVREREAVRPKGSYTSKLFDAGVRAIAQKVGEEGVETALAAVVQDDAALAGEAADLLFHLLVLLRARGMDLSEPLQVLRERHAPVAEANKAAS